MQDVSIRVAAPGDEAALSKVGREGFASAFGHLYAEEDLAAFLDEKHSAEAYAALLRDPAARVWLAERDGRPIGYAVAQPCTLPVPGLEAGAGELSRLYLLEEAQGSGVGSRLLDAALVFLESRFDRIFLSVYAGNEGAQRLYARRGFVKVHEYFYMVGRQADPEWIMELRR